MKLPLYQVDAFASDVFEGNPAAVCPLDEWLPVDVMQNISMENNLSETAFFVERGGNFDLRWFTPSTEVDLCGHATLASAHVLFEEFGYTKKHIRFRTSSGELSVRREGTLLTMDFPVARFKPANEVPGLEEGLGLALEEIYQGIDILCVLESEDQVKSVNPDFKRLAKIPARGVIVTAPGGGADFVSRFFAPSVGVDEDPVTGSAHTMLTPYWAQRLGKEELTGLQISKRGGRVFCKSNGKRVELSGKAQTYLRGEIFI